MDGIEWKVLRPEKDDTDTESAVQTAAELGADKIVFHSGMNPYVYYPEYWADHVSLFWREFMEDRKEIPGSILNFPLYFNL